jgi:hypothetical protein
MTCVRLSPDAAVTWARRAIQPEIFPIFQASPASLSAMAEVRLSHVPILCRFGPSRHRRDCLAWQRWGFSAGVANQSEWGQGCGP